MDIPTWACVIAYAVNVQPGEPAAQSTDNADESF